MKRKNETRFAAEQIATRANWLLIIAAGLLGYGRLDSKTAMVLACILIPLNAASYLACVSKVSFSAKGANICSAVRLIYACTFGFIGTGQLWALAIPTIALEAFVWRAKVRTILFATLAVISEVLPGVLAHHIGPTLLIPPCVTVLGVAAGFWLVQFVAQGEQLGSAGRRLHSLLQCGTELAASAALDSTILDTLKFAVQETKASCGYVMLVDDQRKDVLVT
jgi:hypothetical protein